MARGASSLPEWLEPMAARLTQERFTGPEWTFERKLDGIRLLAFKDGPEVTLYSRNRLPQNDHYPSVVEAITALPVRNVILDGEALGVWGRTGKTAFHIFDILWIDDVDLTSLRLEDRRARLAALPLSPPLECVPELNDAHPWERACREGWEGVIAKRRDSPYEHRRSPHWLKMKCEATQELVVGGFTDPQGSRVGLGSLLVGYFEAPHEATPARLPRRGPRQGAPATDDDFVFAGRVGTGFDRRLLLDLRARLDTIEIPQTPFTKAKDLPRLRTHWVRPEIVVQVSFIEWTVHGKLRHPRLRGVRTDKASRDVVREQP